jgi:hypothetical protein
MVAASSSTNTPTAAAPPSRAAAAMAAAVSSLTALFAFGHMIIPAGVVDNGNAHLKTVKHIQSDRQDRVVSSA